MKVCYDFLNSSYDISKLDFTEEDGTDPLLVDEFAKSKARSYHQNKLSTVRVVKYKDIVVGYFAVSMFSISVEQLATDEKVSVATPLRYPSMLLGQLGVDKKYRGNGIAKEICKFCLGLAQDVGEKVACRYIVLQTNEKRTKLYEDYDFVRSPKKPDNGKIWMYTKLS
ncbi:putative acetyltransferase (GNAT) family protein [Nitrosotalea devaniterrae]|uniref:Putative acetyltransferase (GNAT) family protein n=1 Tax=Nitrosotalea devaniterrae TaxID=1078905 RepID=A0A128A1Z1_9ARCH|nr:putative acetyltransferase (GNAT) family protein [Candidatus Nitrosotalea devanaterra]